MAAELCLPAECESRAEGVCEEQSLCCALKIAGAKTTVSDVESRLHLWLAQPAGSCDFGGGKIELIGLGLEEQVSQKPGPVIGGRGGVGSVRLGQ
jgi:hypothetical protein